MPNSDGPVSCKQGTPIEAMLPTEALRVLPLTGDEVLDRLAPDEAAASPSPSERRRPGSHPRQLSEAPGPGYSPATAVIAPWVARRHFRRSPLVSPPIAQGPESWRDDDKRTSVMMVARAFAARDRHCPRACSRVQISHDGHGSVLAVDQSRRRLRSSAHRRRRQHRALWPAAPHQQGRRPARTN